jgi:serine/threonine-protein kinase
VVAFTAIGGALLAAVAAWCVWVVLSTGGLRAEVERNVSILGALMSIRAAVEDPAADLRDEIEEARTISERLATVAPEAQDDARALVSQLERLARSRDTAARAALETGVERITRALRARNRSLSITLGRRWRYLNAVAVIVVLLAASQSALLVLAHRRRVRVEASEAALRARDQTLRDAARRWAVGDLSTPVDPHGAKADDFEAALDDLRKALVRHVDTLERRTLEVSDLAADLRAQLVRKTTQLAALAPPPGATAEASASRIVAGRYELTGTLGEGGMGAVYRVRRLGDDRQLALKLMRRPRDERQRARFLREARLLAEIDHPNVVRILDVDVSDSQPFFVTELIDGKNLAEVTDWTVETAIPVLRGVAAGLVAIHHRGIIHRDVKLSNVMIGSGRGGDALVKIVDFGIALDVAPSGGEILASPEPRETAVENASLTPDTAALTQQGAIIGTIRYIPPEARLDAPLTSAADIFAFGVVATRLLLGDFPWRDPPITLLQRTGRLPAPAIEGPLVPVPLQELLRRCLAPLPELRPTASEVVDALERAWRAIESA